MKKNMPRGAVIAVLDRADLSDELESWSAKHGVGLDLRNFTSALELTGDGGPRSLDGLAIGVAAAGPFLPEVLRWADNQLSDRMPTLLVGSGKETEDDVATRQILGREQITWLPSGADRDDLKRWLLLTLEVKELRAFRRQHDQIAHSLRRARMQLFHGHTLDVEPPEGPPCGPPLPTNLEEVEPLKEARARFERAHIQAVIREQESLKEASVALGISYTSLWRRLR